MFDRLLGLETEYAIRFSPREGARHPGNRGVYDALAQAIRRQVASSPGERGDLTQQFFTENGGAFCYESLPQAPDGGLIEGATPECRGPRQLLLYQKANDAILERAIPEAELEMAAKGHPGSIGVLKNCRDAEGNVYGAQENYEVEIARGLGLWVYRAGLIALLPLVAICALTMWASMAATLVFLIWIFIGALIAEKANRKGQEARFPDGWMPEALIGQASYWLSLIIWWPVVAPMALLLRAVAFRRSRRCAEAFLISRPVITGAGTLDAGGHFGLSEKGPAICNRMRMGVAPSDRSIFDTGNLMKPMMMLFRLDLAGFKALLRPRQRMQIGLSDSNVAQIAEYLKIGATTLVVDMAEAGFIDDAPRPRRPIEALHALAADPTLRARVEIRGASPMTALEIQQWYCAAARRWVAQAGALSMEGLELVQLWQEALDALADDPGQMVGRLDWITKRYLIEACAEEEPVAVQRKIALRYHELGQGYLARLEAAGTAPILIEAEAIEEATRQPPDDTPARWRGRVIRDHARSDEPIVVSWGSVRVGGVVSGKVIQLSDYKPGGSKP